MLAEEVEREAPLKAEKVPQCRLNLLGCFKQQRNKRKRRSLGAEAHSELRAVLLLMMAT